MGALRSAVDELEGAHGAFEDPQPADPFDLVVWENIAYLADDEARAEAFEVLRRTVGTRPIDIFRAPLDDLLAATSRGIMAAKSAEKLRSAAAIALDEYEGDLGEVLALPPSAAKRALRRFPGIGEPGAEKILLLCRAHPFLAVESNGLRVLTRLGLCPGGESYRATYAVARKLGEDEFDDDFDSLIRARSLLRRHGQRVCRNKAPACGACVLNQRCPSARS